MGPAHDTLTAVSALTVSCGIRNDERLNRPSGLFLFPFLKPKAGRPANLVGTGFSTVMCWIMLSSNCIRLRVDKVCPPLQHYAAVFEIEGRIVGTADLILVDVSELGCNPIGFEMTGFVENGCGTAP
jgi:hypothetical protein